MLNPSGSAADLGQEWKTISQIWEEVQEGWHDSATEDFAAHHWAPLEAHVQAVLQALDQLTPVMSRLTRDCR